MGLSSTTTFSVLDLFSGIGGFALATQSSEVLPISGMMCNGMLGRKRKEKRTKHDE
jgi:hypothetical protein